MQRAKLGLVVAVAFALPVAMQAQNTKQPVKRRQQPIEIRGQVPTPQVVTVRPRDTPEFSRQVLVPNFYDRQFWPVILPGYALVPRRTLAGPTAVVSVSGASPNAGSTTSPVTAPAAPAAPAAPPTGTPADSTRRPPGTAPAR